MYIDDILITCTSYTLVHDLISKLHHKFSIKKLGNPNYFLGIEVHEQHSGAIMLTHTTYIKYILSKANIEGENGVNTLMFRQCKLSKHDTYVISDPTH